MDGVTKGMTIGASTEALAGEGMILTAGGLDSYPFYLPTADRLRIVFRSYYHDRRGEPDRLTEPMPLPVRPALESGPDAGGGGGISHESGFPGKGNCSDEAALEEQVKAGSHGTENP